MRSSWWRRVRYTYFAGVQPRQGLVHHVCVRVCLSVCMCACVFVCARGGFSTPWKCCTTIYIEVLCIHLQKCFASVVSHMKEEEDTYRHYTSCKRLFSECWQISMPPPLPPPPTHTQSLNPLLLRIYRTILIVTFAKRVRAFSLRACVKGGGIRAYVSHTNAHIDICTYTHTHIHTWHIRTLWRQLQESLLVCLCVCVCACVCVCVCVRVCARAQGFV